MGIYRDVCVPSVNSELRPLQTPHGGTSLDDTAADAYRSLESWRKLRYQERLPPVAGCGFGTRQAFLFPGVRLVMKNYSMLF